MTDLISRKALIEEMRKLRVHERHDVALHALSIIANAPAVTSEPVAYIRKDSDRTPPIIGAKLPNGVVVSNVYEAYQAAKADSEREIAELKAHVNRLRESLESASYEVNPHFAKRIDLLLESTPQQSLAEHDNEVFERCAEIVWFYDYISKESSEQLVSRIRALKGIA